MKNLLGIMASLFIASSLMAYQDYSPNYDNYPSHSYDRWQHQPEPQHHYYGQQNHHQYGQHNEYSQYSQPRHKRWEKKYDNLIIMFTKEQCPYCQYMKPIMQQVERRFGDKIKFLYIDLNQYPNVASQYGFSTVPHIVYFKNGQQLDSHGSDNKTMTAEQVEEKINRSGLGQ